MALKEGKSSHRRLVGLLLLVTAMGFGIVALLKPTKSGDGQASTPLVAPQPAVKIDAVPAMELTGHHAESMAERDSTLPARAVPARGRVVDSLTGSTIDARLAACVALAEEGSDQSVRLLLGNLMQEPDGLVIANLAPSLQAITNSAISGLLFDTLTNEQVNGSLVLALVDAVARLATPDVARRIVDSCHTLPEDDSRRSWLLQVAGNLRGEGVPETCAQLLMDEANSDIQVSLAWSLIRHGSTGSISSVIAKIEETGTTNTEDDLVMLLLKATDGENLAYMVEVFDSTTNRAVKWAVGTAISKMQGFDRVAE